MFFMIIFYYSFLYFLFIYLKANGSLMMQQIPKNQTPQTYQQLLGRYESLCMRQKSLDLLNEQLTNLIQSNSREHNQALIKIKEKHQVQTSSIVKAHQNQISMYEQRVILSEDIKNAISKENQLLKQQLKQVKQTNNLYSKQLNEYSKKQPTTLQNDQHTLYSNMKQMKMQISQLEEQLSQTKQANQRLNISKQALNLQLNQLLHQKQIINRQKQSHSAQMTYYRQENQQLKQQITQLKHKIQQLKSNTQKLVEEENEKWWKINQNLLSRVNSLQKNRDSVDTREQKLYKEIAKYKQVVEQQKNKNKDIVTELNWYKKLLQEAKAQFVSSQLQKQSTNQKLLKQNSQLNKQLKRIKQQVKQNNTNKISKMYKNKVHSKSIMSRSPLNKIEANNVCSVFEMGEEDRENRQSAYFAKTPDKSSILTTAKSKKVNNRLTPKK